MKRKGPGILYRECKKRKKKKEKFSDCERKEKGKALGERETGRKWKGSGLYILVDGNEKSLLQGECIEKRKGSALCTVL